MLAKRLIRLVSIFLILLVPACSSDVFHNQDADVVSITIDDPIFLVGVQKRIVVNIEYDDDKVFRDNDDVAVAVVLPSGLEYRLGSAEIDGNFDDESVDPIIVPCSDGSTILFFDLDDDDLSGADDPSSRADARLEMDIRAISANSSATIQARADYNSTNASCGFALDAQATLIVAVDGGLI